MYTDKFKILSSFKRDTKLSYVYRFTDKSSQNKFIYLSSTEYTKCSKYAYVYYTTRVCYNLFRDFREYTEYIPTSDWFEISYIEITHTI